MAKDKIPSTPAIRLLKQHKADFVPCLYKYEDRGGTEASARELGVCEHQVIKTLIMEDEQQHPFIILMHGDCEVSVKQLARQLKVKQVSPCVPAKADRVSGYQTGGISPFGTKQKLPVYMEAGIADLEKIYINGGRRGMLVEISPTDLIRILSPVSVEATQ